MSQDEGSDESGGIIYKLRSRYAVKIGLLVLVVTGVLVALGFFTFTSVEASVQGDTEDALASAAEREAAGIADFVESRNEDTRTLSAEGDLTSVSESEVQERFNTRLRQLPESVVAIHLFDTNNNTIEVSTDPEAEGRVTTDAGDDQFPWLDAAAALSGPSGVQSFDPYEVNGERRLGFTSKVDDGDEDHLVVLIVDLESRSELLTAPIEDSGVEVISHANNQIVLGQNPGTLFTRPAYLNEIEELETGTYSQPEVDLVSSESGLVDDNDLVVASAPVENKRWSVVVVASQTSAFDTVDEVSRSLLILIGVALLGLIIVGAVITRDINNSLNRTTGYAEQIENGNLAVEIDHSRSDEFGQLSGQFARLRDALKDQIRSSEQARKEAEVARAEAEEMAEYLQQKASEYSEVMQQVGAGDLTQRMDQDGEEESMDQIAEEFNDMIEELEKTTGQLKSYVDEVEQSGTEVEQSALTVREASEQVAESIQKISDDAHQQKEQLESILGVMDEIADELEGIAAERDDIDIDDTLAKIRDNVESIDDVSKLTEETMAESEEVAGAAEEQAAELNTVSERAHDLQQYAQPLRDILERFETEKEHEFVFSVGPTGGARSPESPGDQAGGDEATED